MSDATSQIQAAYNALEDRILLNIKTHNDQLYSAWITRRYMSLLIPALQGQHPQTGETLFGGRKLNMAAAAKHEMADNDFESDFVPPEDPHYPLGQTPILLTRITFKGLDSDNPQLNLEPEEGLGIALPFQPQLMNILWKVFSQALNSAEWQLDLKAILQLPSTGSLQ